MKHGTVSPSFERGSILLMEGHRFVRLVWSGEKKPVSLPAGSYTIVNYKIERAHEGVEWHLSGSAPCGKGPVVGVKEGAETKLEIDDRVHVGVSAQAHHGNFRLSFGVSGHEGMGLSVVKSEARPTPRWAVARDGADLHSGDFAYG